jgi:hypothetical protein
MYTVDPDTTISFTRPFVWYVGTGCAPTTAQATPATASTPIPATAIATAKRLRTRNIANPRKDDYMKPHDPQYEGSG